MVILITNDDGLDSEGLIALKEELEKVGEVWVFATWEDRSGSSHAITLTRAIRVMKVQERVFKVDGTPTDCVNIAINGIMPKAPDIVVSGINIGENIGDDTLYSGTFGGAIEGALLGIPSFAVSAKTKDGRTGDLRAIARMTREIIKFSLENPLPKRVVLNINFPFFKSAREIKGVKFAKLSRRVYGEKALHFQDPRGRDFWFIGGKELRVDADGYEDLKELDYFVLEEKYISITPVKVEFKIDFWLDDLSLLSENIRKEAFLWEESQEEP
jgi:5'-nucleotidase